MRFGDKYYYGLTSNIDKRRRSHNQSIFKVMTGDTTSHSPLKIHFEAATFLNKIPATSYEDTLHAVRIIPFFETKCKKLAEDVERFMIQSSLSDKNCCNTKVKKVVA